MFLDAYTILKESQEEETTISDDSLAYKDAERELEKELNGVDDLEEDLIHHPEEVPVVSYYTNEDTKYYINAGDLFKYMASQNISSIEEGMVNVLKVNRDSIDNLNETYLVLDAKELSDLTVEEAVAFVESIQRTGIKIVKEADEEESEDDEEDKKSSKEDDDDDEDDKKSKKKCSKKDKDDDEEDDDEDDDKEDKKSSKEDDDEDEKDDEEDDDKNSKEVLKDTDSVKESLIYTKEMLPITKSTKSNKYFIEYYNLNRYMKANKITSIKEAYRDIIREYDNTLSYKNTAIVINGNDIRYNDIKTLTSNIREAKADGIKLYQVAVNEMFENFRLSQINKKIAKTEESITKVKEKLKWWKSLSPYERDSAAMKRQILSFVMMISAIVIPELLARSAYLFGLSAGMSTDAFKADYSLEECQKLLEKQLNELKKLKEKKEKLEKKIDEKESKK